LRAGSRPANPLPLTAMTADHQQRQMRRTGWSDQQAMTASKREPFRWRSALERVRSTAMKLETLVRRNEHGIDRALRIVVGLALLALVVVGPKTYWGLIGLVPLLTGLVGSCPVYMLLGVSTCPPQRRNRDGGMWAGGARV